ncbi:MAG: hypothetical protein PHO70_01055 [Candidatus Omnitrophica bacterium]|nr:hypothetical protein [Candidatus Omnitrophota bacterium]
MLSLRGKKAQSTLEYILVLTAIVAAIVVVSQGVIKEKVISMFGNVANQADKAVSKINFDNEE